MQYIELHHQYQSVNCASCGTLNNQNLTAQFVNNGEIQKEISFKYNPHLSGNWSGQMMDVYISLINELGYSTQFSGHLESYSDAYDFNPENDFDFYSSTADDKIIIPVHVTYERDFFQIGVKKFDFNDIPRIFTFELNGSSYSIHTNSFENFYQFLLSQLIPVSKFNHHEHEEFFEQKPEY